MRHDRAKRRGKRERKPRPVVRPMWIFIPPSKGFTLTGQMNAKLLEADWVMP